MASIALNYALNNGMTQEQYDQRIFDYVAQNVATKTPAELRIEMDRLGVSPADVARATGVSAADVKAQYAEALPQTQAEMIAKAAADKELAGRVAKDTTATQATRDIYSQAAAVSQGLLGPDTAAQAKAAAEAAALAASQKAAAEKLAADNAAAAAATAAAAAAAKKTADEAAAAAAAIAASNATAAAKAAAAKVAADALAASNAAAAKAAADAKAAAAAQAATDAGLAAAAAAAKKIADDAAAAAAAIAASNATAAEKAAAAKAAADAKAASDAAAAKVVADAAAAKAAADAAAKAAAAKTTTGANSTGLAYALNSGMTQAQYYKNIFDFYSKNSGLSDSMLRSEMDRLGISPQDVAAATGVTVDSVLSRYNAAKATTPAELAAQKAAQDDLAARQGQWATQQKANDAAWAAQQAKNAADWAAQQKLTQDAQNAFGKAPLTLGQKFGSYESIPIGAQYNPAVTPGGVSPYSMVMGQMTPFQNPYANFVPGTALGGYNPNLYSDIATNNAAAAAAKAAAENQAANNALMMNGAAGGGDATSAAAAATAAANAANAAAAVTGESVSVSGETGESVSGVYNKGGIVDGLFGPNPPGPDDGAGLLDRGEYVIKKSAVNKYGRGLLDMINEGKMPAKKIRSLLD